jgi:hypothetical protein
VKETTLMSLEQRHDGGSKEVLQRLDRLENRLANGNRRMLYSVMLNVLLVGLLLSSCRTQSITDTIEARKVILKDPSGHTLAVLGGANHAKIQFYDEKGQVTMNLSGRGISFDSGDQHAGLTASDLSISRQDTHILLNPLLFSFQAKEGQLLLLHHPSGMNLTIRNTSGSEFGVVTDGGVASLYAASARWEVDLTADKSGTHVVRTPRRE